MTEPTPPATLADRRKSSQRSFLAKMLLAFLACGACNTASRPARDPNTATVALDVGPLALDPRFATDAAGSHISSLIAAGLIRVDDRGVAQPELATAWQIFDARIYEFELHEGLRFSDGSALTADDVKATFDSIVAADSSSPKRAAFGALAQIEIVAPLRIRFTLHTPFAPFLNACQVGILPKRQIAAAEQRPIALPVGSGAYRLAEVRSERSVRLERNPYALRPPALHRIDFRIVPDATTRLLGLQRGDYDLVQNGVEPLALRWIARQTHLRVLAEPGTTFQYLGFNLRQAPLSSLAVRRALAYGTDREALIAGVFGGQARSASGLLAPLNWHYSDAVRTYPYAPQRAARLLDAAGFLDPDGDGPQPRFRLRYKTTTVELRRRMAEALQAQWAKIGVALDITSSDWATFYADIRAGRFEIFSLAWVGSEDPDIYFSAFHSSQQPPAGNNRGHFVDPLTDRLTLRARSCTDARRRRHLYAMLQRRLSQQLPTLPLWWTTNVAVLHRRLQGYHLSSNGSYDGLRDAWLESN